MPKFFPSIVRKTRRQKVVTLKHMNPVVALRSRGARARPCCTLVAALLLFAACAPLRVGQDDDEALPGLLARYSAGKTSIVRVDPDVAFEWNSASPDPRLAPAPFTAHWTGRILIREIGSFRFHAYLQGTATLKIEGHVVLEGRRDAPGWISGRPQAIPLGEKPIEITFDAVASGATLKLYWSSDRFRLEPLSAHLLLHDEAAGGLLAQEQTIEAGRRAFEGYRCGRCHRRSGIPSFRAPSLIHVAQGLRPSEIAEKLARRVPLPGEKMPTFELSGAEAADVAAFLISNSEPLELPRVPPGKNWEKDVRNGEAHVRSFGCCACHTVGAARRAARRGGNAPEPSAAASFGRTGPYGGGDLSTIGSKRSAEWLWTWLQTPELINSDHRMPVFKLSTNERRQIVAYLSSLQYEGNADGKPKTQAINLDSQHIERGRQLIVRMRCAACHEIKNVSADVDRLSDLSGRIGNWNASCVAPRADRRRFRPAFPGIDRNAVIAYVVAYADRVSPECNPLLGERLLERKNCTACHARGGQQGLGAMAASLTEGCKLLEGRAAALVPPNLTAIGDKLHDTALAEAIVGGAKKRRMGWLAVRMPRFRHSDAERAALVAALIAHDRIPAGAPQSEVPPSTQASVIPKADDWLAAGQRLVGVKGFSCVACHEMGKYVPQNVALATHGSDLLQLDRRMRREFFMRWTRSPLRIRPGMEMPSYERPAAGILDDDVDRQLAAVWDALNNRRFAAPTDPSSVEQFFAVRPGDPARIVRDVFQNRDGGGGPVPRAFAIGLSNGHSILIDLDRFCLRDWRVGEFARQRTIGKSWFWDLAGLPVAKNLDSAAEITLHKGGTAASATIRPKGEFGSAGRLERYGPFGEGVELFYRLNFEVNGKSALLGLRETLAPLPAEKDRPGGFRRRWEVIEPIDGYAIEVHVPRPAFLLEKCSIERVGRNSEMEVEYRCGYVPAREHVALPPARQRARETIDVVPGFDGVRLPLDASIMPTAIAWTPDGTLAFTSLKGQVYLARDSDGDGIEDRLRVFEEGLAAPYGLIADGPDLIVAHKPELLRLRDANGDGRADERTLLASGWGFTEDYHDWTCGIARDRRGNLYVGLGSDYTRKNRPAERSRWRGKVLRIDREGHVFPIAHALRYPTGIALDERERLFVTDNQGDQNPFNEINYLTEGGHYGVPSSHEEDPQAPTIPPAVQIPHPWTRSVNGICFLPRSLLRGPLAGQAIGCEYNGRFLVRFTVQEVEGTLQGAVYPFSRMDSKAPRGTTSRRPGPAETRGFLGPLCCAVSPRGDLYIGGIEDSGWLGGANVGEIVRLRPAGSIPCGIREIRATSDGFELSFFSPVDRATAANSAAYSVVGYTRVWKGTYATPDSGRHTVTVRRSDVSADGLSVALHTDRLREGFVYEVICSALAGQGKAELWPDVGYYTLHRIPRAR